MERACFTFEIYPDKQEEYKRRHDEIWPDMVTAIADAGLRNYTLFRRGVHVVGYVECHPDVTTAFAKIAESQVNARWAESFKDIIASLTDENGELRLFSEVWHQD